MENLDDEEIGIEGLVGIFNALLVCGVLYGIGFLTWSILWT